MFGLFNFNKEEPKEKEHDRKDVSSDERKLRETMNEVASELGVSTDETKQSSQNANELGEQVKKELKKRT
ncbi:hypothetical protein JOD24_000986 [Kroppenstedtia sanguinis]|uniref:DUF948 domain-containing protein n=1 Tax=Kroppenstedtia sanguinis TaxID=1380684 RepID=A0ABW4C7Q3_9BACL